MKSYLDCFTDYAPELGVAINRMGAEFIADLNSPESSAAFDVYEAFSVFWPLWHDGHRLYALGSNFNNTFDFKPADNLSFDGLSDDGKMLYLEIARAFEEYDEEAEKWYETTFTA